MGKFGGLLKRVKNFINMDKNKYLIHDYTKDYMPNFIKRLDDYPDGFIKPKINMKDILVYK